MEKIIGLDLSPLRKLAKKMSKYRYKRSGRWKFIPSRVLDKVLEEYCEYWESVVSQHLPYDPKKHQIDMTQLFCSEDVDRLCYQILPGMIYVDISPAVDKSLPSGTCRLTDKTLRERDSGERT